MNLRINLMRANLVVALGLFCALPAKANAKEVGKAISLSYVYGCVPYIEHPQANKYKAYLAKSTWNKAMRTFQCYYKIGKGSLYKAPEGRLILDDAVTAAACRHSSESNTLHCPGK